MTRHAETLRLYEQMHAVLADEYPMTVRQVYYQLVARQLIENSAKSYDHIQQTLVSARYDEAIPWDWIVDRVRSSLGSSHGSGTIRSYLQLQRDYAAWGYSRDVWPTQPRYVEMWVEKDALAGIFESALLDYPVGLNVGRGYSSASEVRQVALRMQREQEHEPTIVYFGDYDPSGEDMVVDLRARLAEFGAEVRVVKLALTRSEVDRHQLPHAVTKVTDSRRAKYIAQHGDVAVELDALTPSQLREYIQAALKVFMDLEALGQVRQQEQRDRATIQAAFDTLVLPDEDSDDTDDDE